MALNIGELSGSDRQHLESALLEAWQQYKRMAYSHRQPGELSVAVVRQLWPDLPTGVLLRTASLLETRGIIPSEKEVTT